MKFVRVQRLLAVVLAGLAIQAPAAETSPQERPNILWLVCEDISPYLGCYGYEQAHTPNLDRFAEQGVRYLYAYANAPVCGVSRATLLTGMHAITTGSSQFRARPAMPDSVPIYGKLLRQAGYYCTNNAKRDYNSLYENDRTIWDESSGQAHWKNRPEGKPFFAIFNIEHSHEGQISPERWAGHIRNGLVPETPRLDPEKVTLPSYMPDLPEVRADWVRFMDQITMMDGLFQMRLSQMERAGLAEDTIVIFTADHGGHLARSKRYIYNGGTQVPFIVRVPEKWKHLAPGEPGTASEELLQFVDLPKTFLALAGAEPPDIMQGRVLFGPKKEPAPETVHFYRDRMAERPDCSRAVTDGRFYYIHNFMPHRPRGRDSRFGNQVQRNWGAWEAYYDDNPEAVAPVASQFYKPKPTIELHDLATDPGQINNLADDPKYQAQRERLAADLEAFMLECRDTGLIPEALTYELVGEGKEYATIYDYAQSDDYPIELVIETAQRVSSGDPGQLGSYLDMMRHAHPIIRHWGAYGVFLVRNQSVRVQKALNAMIKNDPYAGNRVIAAQALGLCGDVDTAYQVLMREAVATKQSYVFYHAVNALQYSHADVLMSKEDWQTLDRHCTPGDPVGDRLGYAYARRVIRDALALWPKRRMVD